MSRDSASVGFSPMRWNGARKMPNLSPLWAMAPTLAREVSALLAYHARHGGIVMANVQVLDPTGYPPKISAKALAPRLDTLDGRTVYLVDCRFDDSDVFLGQMRAWFAERMPAVTTVLKRIS